MIFLLVMFVSGITAALVAWLVSAVSGESVGSAKCRPAEMGLCRTPTAVIPSYAVEVCDLRTGSDDPDDEHEPVPEVSGRRPRLVATHARSVA